MDDLTRLKILLDGKNRPDLKSLADEIGRIFDNDEIQLRESQKMGLARYSKYRRSFDAMGVGEGKTILSLLAFLVARSYRGLLFLPPNLVEKTLKVDIPKIEKWFNIKLDVCSLFEKSQHQRRQLMNKHRITIFPYSLLSVEDTEDLLELSHADLIIADECHELKYKDVPKTKRFLKYIDANPNCGLGFMSGTIIHKSLLDYHHLICRSLKHLAPLPFELSTVYEIQDATSYDVFSKVKPSRFLCQLNPKLKAGYGEYLVNVEESKKFLKTLFKASPGTGLTENQSVECSIFINVIEIKTPDKLQKIIDQVKKDWCTPSGDELEDYLSVMSLLAQLSSGFYYRLFWDENTPEWAIDNWKAKNDLTREIRHWIKWRHRVKLDTPGLVRQALEKDLPTVSKLQPTYKKWQDSFKGNLKALERSRERIWVSDYKVLEAVKWAKTAKNGIIWYKWDESGEALQKALPGATFCPAGCDVLLLAKSGILLCSMAHAEGQNLQHLSNNLLFDLPESGSQVEQLIGRTHRQGQLADCVNVDILVANEVDENIVRRVYLQSKYLHDTNQQRKFVIADWSTDKFIKKGKNDVDLSDMWSNIEEVV